jgi:hypothetical protein
MDIKDEKEKNQGQGGQEIKDKGAYFISLQNNFYSLIYFKTNILQNYPKDNIFVAYIDANGVDYIGNGDLSYADFEESFKMYDLYYSHELSAQELYDAFKNKFKYPLEFYERWKVMVEGQLKMVQN